MIALSAAKECSHHCSHAFASLQHSIRRYIYTSQRQFQDFTLRCRCKDARMKLNSSGKNCVFNFVFHSYDE